MRKIKALWNYLIGEFYCRKFHRPLFYDLGSYGGTDYFGRRRGSYNEWRCTKCWRTWEKNAVSK